MMNNNFKYAIAGASGIAVGFAAGYLISNAKSKKLIDKGFKEITAKYEDSLQRIQKTGPYSTVSEAASALIEEETTDEVLYSPADVPLDIPEDPEDEENEEEGLPIPQDLLDKYKDRIDEYGRVSFPGEETHEEEEEVEEAEDEVIDEYDPTPESSTPGFVTVRDPNGPYVISIDEYMDDDSPYTKVEMTYFEGDDTLIDSREQIVPDIEGVIGTKNLNRWGDGTTDPDQVYIRNERLEMDIEVTREDNTYTRVVLGIIPAEEIARSMTKPLKMRDGDGN